MRETSKMLRWGIAAALGLGSAGAMAAPVVTSIITNYTGAGTPTSLSITGTGFCAAASGACTTLPTVSVGGVGLTVANTSTATSVTATWTAAPPDGDYVLAITSPAGTTGAGTTNWNLTVHTNVGGATGATGATGSAGATGAAGARGAAGAAGATGAAGAAGARGATGATGAAGTNGTNGSNGATGATGPAGTNGTNGAPGAPGATGATGPAGAAGAAGATGATGPTGTFSACAGATPYLMITSTTATCQGRFVDNGDGTVTDNLNHLIWEKKVTGSGDVHDSANKYTWSAGNGGNPGALPADGTVFSTFLDTLNANMTDTPGTSPSCFTGHCDWRLPTVEELRSLQSGSVAPIIDPALGTTIASYYWSGTTVTASQTYAWYVSFAATGLTQGNIKTSPYYARAVRSAR